MSKTRVYELAKELKLPSKDIIEKAKQLGISYNSHMSTMEDGEVSKIKASISTKEEPKKGPRSRPGLCYLSPELLHPGKPKA